MSPEDLQKLRILANSNDEFVNAASSKLIDTAENNGHSMAAFTIIEGLLCSQNVKYEILAAFCVKCLYEIEIECGKNHNGEFADIKISGEEKCVCVRYIV